LSHTSLNNRKSDHIELAFRSQLSDNDNRFYYEPLFSASPDLNAVPQIQIAGKTMKAPWWISSMTGGAEKAGFINKNLAKAAQKYGLGMGLGSCRPVLEQRESAADFKIRPLIGDQPLFANLGIAQLEQLFLNGQSARVHELIKELEADGLIIHVNPLQEWFQPEGDTFQFAAIDTIKRCIDVFHFPLMVKEVGQGLGPKSLKALLELPLEALDYGAFGGTNFALLENLRTEGVKAEEWIPATRVGHTAEEMTQWICDFVGSKEGTIQAKNIIVSGGIKGFLDGYYHLQKLPHSAMYAQAAPFLKYALLGEEPLFEFVEAQLEALAMSYHYLTLKS
jgi:isopentenyl-diphosphate Delta-isomerase